MKEKPRLSLQEISSLISSNYPDYVLIKEKKKNVTFKASPIIGISIFQRKKDFNVDVFFPDLKAKSIFYSCVVLGGIIIPLTLYFIFFHGKMRRIKKDISAFIQSNS